MCEEEVKYRLISHRGNIEGKSEKLENNPGYIFDAIMAGYEVEIDLRLINGRWYLGHDIPQYEVGEGFIYDLASREKIWTHIKNVEALSAVTGDKRYISWNYFWHQSDDYTITSKNYIWAYPGKKLVKNSICVLPEIANYDTIEVKECLGVCSDYVGLYK